MSFENFSNPYRNPADVPQKYRNHFALLTLFRADGAYQRAAEDPVTMWAITVLHEEYDVPLEVMELEVGFNPSESAQRTSHAWSRPRVDLVIYDDRYIGTGNGLDIAFIALEAIEPSRVPGTPDWEEHFDTLNKYMSNSPSARYAILTCGTHTRIFLRDLGYPRQLQEIGRLSKYERAGQAAEHRPFTVILSPDEPDGIETGLTALKREQFREVLGDTRSGCHSILRDNEGLQPQEAVDAMVKFLIAKWYDEQETVRLAKQTGEARAYVFSVNTDTDPERLAVQVRDTFEKAKQWERETLQRKFGDALAARLAFNEGDTLLFKPHTTVEIVKRLQPWSLRRSTADVKGGVFEDFLSKTFRDDLGQYFTPTPVINLMVGMLQPTVNDFVGDPACGSARMLTHVLEYVREQEYQKAVAANGGSKDGINREEPTDAFIEFRDNHLFGAETSRNVMHVARVNTLMNGAQFADLKVMDSLSMLGSITGGVNEGLPTNPGFYPGGLTMILTNPPFGSKVTTERVLRDFASRDGVTKRNGKVIDSIPQEIAFVNRCLELLAPGGKLGIVLPDGVLANSSMQDVRDWIVRWARLKAEVSLPQETFAPYGAGVKTSVIFLEKRAQPLPAAVPIPMPSKNGRGRKKASSNGTQPLDLEVDEAPAVATLLAEPEDALPDEDYDVYMARIDNIGYDANGRLGVPESQAHTPPQVRETVEDFATRSGWKNDA